jgi:hypothetical protein
MDYYNQSKALLKKQGFDELTQRILEQSRNYLEKDFIYQRLGTGSKPELPSIDETLRSMENPWSYLLKMVVFMDITFTHQELRMRYGQSPP